MFDSYVLEVDEPAVRRGERGLGMGGHHRPNRGLKDEWLTPPEIIADLGPFDLDPCAAVGQPWATATYHHTIDDDGLSRLWHGFVWCNPPYGQQTWPWLARMAEHGHGIALTFGRTETAGFFKEVWSKADAILFVKGRLFFHHVDGRRADHNSGAPSVLLAYGETAVSRLRVSAVPGALVERWRLTC